MALTHPLPYKLSDEFVLSRLNRAGSERERISLEFVVTNFGTIDPVGKQAGFDMMRHFISFDGVTARVGDVVSATGTTGEAQGSGSVVSL